MTRVSRREFARAAGAAVGAALLPRAARAGQPAPAEKPTAHAPAPSPHAPALAPAAQAEAEARVQMIVARYGARLSPAERADLHRLSATAQKLLDEVRAFPLDYGDEPAHIFRASRRPR